MSAVTGPLKPQSHSCFDNLFNGNVVKGGDIKRVSGQKAEKCCLPAPHPRGPIRYHGFTGQFGVFAHQFTRIDFIVCSTKK